MKENYLKGICHFATQNLKVIDFAVVVLVVYLLYNLDKQMLN